MKVTRLDELPRLAQSEGALFRPIRRALGLTGVSVNAYTGERPGDEVIESHDELSPNAAGHEELYFVAAGHAAFEVDGEAVDAPAGTMVAVAVGELRAARAVEAETTVVVFGGASGAAFPPAPFEYWYAADPHYVAGEYEQGLEILREGLEHHPESPGLNYQLACYYALSGGGEAAVRHLRVALAGPDPKVRDWAAGDEDLDSIRERGDFPDLSG